MPLGSHQRTFTDFFVNKASTVTPSYRKSSIMPPGGGGRGGAYLFPTHLKGGLFERGGLFNLAKKMMVSVLLRELEYKVEKF